MKFNVVVLIAGFVEKDTNHHGCEGFVKDLFENNDL